MKRLTNAVIDRNAAYEAGEFLARTGLSRSAFTEARRDGLPVVKVGLRRYVLGASWLTYLAHKAATDGTGGQQPIGRTPEPGTPPQEPPAKNLLRLAH